MKLKLVLSYEEDGVVPRVVDAKTGKVVSNAVCEDVEFNMVDDLVYAIVKVTTKCAEVTTVDRRKK